MTLTQALTPTFTDQLTLVLNGSPQRIVNLPPTTTLLEYLRQSGHVGTKEGCGDGDCGACTVAILGKDAQGQPQYQAVNSCLIPIGAVAGREILTAEGIGNRQHSGQMQSGQHSGQHNGQMHPVQAAMIETGGSQCGYCTPGFIMSLFAAYYDGSLGDDICIEGNLCRCTGYLPIRKAAQQLITDSAALRANPDATLEDSFSASPAHNSPAHKTLDLPALAYTDSQQQFYRPTELSAALNLLQQHPDATLVAGATDLGLEMSWHRQQYPVLISLEAIESLQQIEQTDVAVELGAALPLSQIEAKLRGVFPSLDEMLHWFAARQVRNRATIGGNIGTASPIGDLPPVLLALDASVKLVSAQGERALPLADFFKGYRQTELKSGEIIYSVTIPKALTPGAAKRLSQSYKIGKRGTDDISIVAAAFTVDLDAEQKIRHVRLGYGGVAATPIRAVAVEEMLLGQTWSLDTVRSVQPALQEVFRPLGDLRGSADYRKRLVANLFEKFFVEMSAS